MNELTNEELIALICMVKNKQYDLDKVIQKFGTSSGREMVWDRNLKLLAKLQIILEDRQGGERNG